MRGGRRRAASGRGSAAPARLEPAVFLARPNRFVVAARLRGGRRVLAHLADPGRLRELLVPGAELRLKRAPAGAGRRTRWTAALVRAPGRRRVWVSLDTTLPNRLAARLFESGAVPGAGRAARLAREVRLGRSRFDFALRDLRGAETLVEVKSVTLVEDGVALFPDAPTVRGARHLSELEDYVRAGGRALVLFVVQRGDARAVAPNARTDPRFARALLSAARAGVMLRAVRFSLDGDGRASYRGRIEVGSGPRVSS